MNIHHIYTPLLLVTEAFIHVMLSYLRTTPKIGRQFCNPSATLLAVDTCLPVENSPQYQGDESQDSTSFLERTFGRGNTFWVYIFERTQGGNGKKYEEVMPYCFVWLFGLYSQLSEMFCYQIFWFRFVHQTMARTWQFRLMFFQNTLGR